MSVNDENDLKGIVEASKVAKHLREVLFAACVPGMTTADLDNLCRSELKALGATSAPRAEYQAPCYAFYSVNSCVVHGLPNRTPLQAGDLVKIDVTPRYQGFVADTACTKLLGTAPANSTALRLVASVERAFHRGLDRCQVGRPVNRIGQAIEASTRSDGFAVVPELSGHSVGRAIHEEPSVYNVFEPHQRATLTEGLVLAIEPMICNRPTPVRTLSDRWSVVARDGLITAHYEHTVLLTRTGTLVLTA